MKVTLSLRSQENIRSIARFVAADSPRAADRLATKLFDAARDIASFPKRFAFAPGVEHLGVRRRPVGAYSIFYVIRNEDVIVLRVAHGAQDYPRLFTDG